MNSIFRAKKGFELTWVDIILVLAVVFILAGIYVASGGVGNAAMAKLGNNMPFG